MTGGGTSRWKTFGERVIYDNPWVWLGQVDVELPDGERFWHHVVRLRPDAPHRVWPSSSGWSTV